MGWMVSCVFVVVSYALFLLAEPCTQFTTNSLKSLETMNSILRAQGQLNVRYIEIHVCTNLAKHA